MSSNGTRIERSPIQQVHLPAWTKSQLNLSRRLPQGSIPHPEELRTRLRRDYSLHILDIILGHFEFRDALIQDEIWSGAGAVIVCLQSLFDVCKHARPISPTRQLSAQRLAQCFDKILFASCNLTSRLRTLRRMSSTSSSISHWTMPACTIIRRSCSLRSSSSTRYSATR